MTDRAFGLQHPANCTGHGRERLKDDRQIGRGREMTDRQAEAKR